MRTDNQANKLLHHLWFLALLTFVSSVKRMSSRRAAATERPYIEDVLDKYCVPGHNLTMMALGSSHWGPPTAALQGVLGHVASRETQRYGNILGLPELRERLAERLVKRGLGCLEKQGDMTLAITSGANQAFTNIALALCDQGDHAVLLSPYYFSHKLALQLAGVQVSLSQFNPTSHKPDLEALSRQFSETKPRMFVMTTPSNPSGVVFCRSDLEAIVELCRKYGTWLVVDQVYHDFLYDNAEHIFPCNRAFKYERIVHIFSLSKCFGMAGWRVGYAVFPSIITDDFRKIQDTNPTHATILSQRLALECLDADESTPGGWIQTEVRSLERVREALWSVVGPLGTIKSTGAFYFLVPLPKEVSEEEAVHLLASDHGVLLMLGSPFGAAQHLRLSYGGLHPDSAMDSIGRLARGFQEINRIAESRRCPPTQP